MVREAPSDPSFIDAQAKEHAEFDMARDQFLAGAVGNLEEKQITLLKALAQSRRLIAELIESRAA
jgi:hypothetical protein